MNSMINWMGGWPKEGLVSSADWEERVEEAATIAATQQLGGVESKRDPFGEEKLRGQLANGLLKAKTGGNPNQIMVMRGADNALAWILENKVMPGDTILTERLTSRSALQAFRKAGLRVEAVEGDRRGMDPESLTTALFRHRPKLVYVSPSCTDPEGVCWSAEIRTAVQIRCKEAGVLLVTDDRQEMLLYEGNGYPPSRRLEPGVLSIGQFPPGLVAGLRIGWIAGTTELLSSIGNGNSSRNENRANPIEQKALSRLMDEQPLDPLFEMLRIQCGERMRRMTEQLANKQIEDLSWVEPRGGLHLWVVLPSGLDGEALLRGAWLKGLIFQPGSPYFVKDVRINTLRMTHAFADERQMRQGLARLADSIAEFTGRWSRS